MFVVKNIKTKRRKKMTDEMYEDLLERNKLQISELNTLTEEQDRHIVELEKENAELKEQLETTEKTRDYWKDSSFDWRHKCTSRKPFRAAVEAQEQLTKAKEIIRDLLQVLPKENIEGIYEITEEAEQFLNSEVEK